MAIIHERRIGAHTHTHIYTDIQYNINTLECCTHINLYAGCTPGIYDQRPLSLHMHMHAIGWKKLKNSNVASWCYPAELSCPSRISGPLSTPRNTPNRRTGTQSTSGTLCTSLPAPQTTLALYVQQPTADQGSQGTGQRVGFKEWERYTSGYGQWHVALEPWDELGRLQQHSTIGDKGRQPFQRSVHEVYVQT